MNLEYFMSSAKFSEKRPESTWLITLLSVGIYVKAFEDRLDLYSVMMSGPVKTPYQDFLLFFDVHLPANYPSVPPKVHFHPPRIQGKTQKASGFLQVGSLKSSTVRYFINLANLLP